ncbi:phosphoribosyl-AMP cyclohydrolase [bacterium]|nr:phosphoribosyl-AMP cyclohydrolase [bacterium]
MHEQSLQVEPALLNSLKFNDKGLIPVIAQEISTGIVLMVAYMNQDSLKITLETGYATYWSRSRQKLWKKGETSGNVQSVKGILVDCDQDALVLLIDQKGPACHTGEKSCFYRALAKKPGAIKNIGCVKCTDEFCQ